MGVMRFQVYPADRLDSWPEVHRAYISGVDGRVFPTRVEVEGNVVSCRRQNSDSGKMHVAWRVPGFGSPIITTASLREQENSYIMAVELARGKICQVRDQLAAWEGMGMKIPDEFHPLYKEAHRLFAKATAGQEEPELASRLADDAIAQACQAAEILTCAYIEQRLSVRRKKSPKLPALLGCNLGVASPRAEWKQQICEAFNAVAVPIEWRLIEPEEGNYHWELNDVQVEWCLENKLLVRGGPLLDFSPTGLPKWLGQWQHDFFNLQSFVCDFVETAISRYLGRIRIWEVASHVNTAGALNLSEDNLLTVVARTLEVARQVDEEAHLLIRVDQPWGRYQSHGQHRLSPTQFVDALIRCGVGLSGVNLEISIGYHPRGTASRDLLDFSRLIDLWSTLEVPLHVTLAFPSTASDDPNSKSDLKVDSNGWKTAWSEAAQADWIKSYLPLLMAKQSVAGIFWTHLTDSQPHEFPNAGLLDALDNPKPALEQFVKTRHANWT